MAKVSFDVAATMQDNNTEFNNNVEFFALADDGDEAVVRFLHDDTSSFNIMTVHNIQVGGKWRKVNCIRDPQESTDVCPLCASGNNITNKFFIHMLVYSTDQQGNIVAKPAVWERGFSYATKLKTLIDEYGPLSNELFKVRRCGAKGSLETTYEILYCSPKVYNRDIYPVTADAFNNWKELGTIVMDKDAIAMNTYLSTGSFPEVQQVAAAPQPVATQPTYVPKQAAVSQPVPQPAPSAAPTYNAPAAAPAYAAPTATPPGTPPWMNTNTSVAPGKPSPRYY